MKEINGLLLIGDFYCIYKTALYSIPVYGYIDPSAVTYVIQAVAGAVIAVGALITVFRHKIVAFFSKGKKEKQKKQIHIKEEEE